MTHTRKYFCFKNLEHVLFGVKKRKLILNNFNLNIIIILNLISKYTQVDDRFL